MGQYYRFINIDKKQTCLRNIGFLKLTEHSYLGNEYCNDILSLLSNEWKNDRIVHIGDYAEDDNRTSTEIFMKKLHAENNIPETVYHWSFGFEDVEPSKEIKTRYVYNHDRKEYIDLLKQPIQWCCVNKNRLSFAKFNSFALLTACGNGQGGGDYAGISEEYVGFWVGDRLETSEDFLEEYENYNERDTFFNECLKISDVYDGYSYNESKDIIHRDEKTVFNEYLEDLDKSKIDISKLKINGTNLTIEEKIIFKEELEKYKQKYDEKQIDTYEK